MDIKIFLSDAQLDTSRNIPGKFQLNPSSRLGGVVLTRFGDGHTYRHTDRGCLQANKKHYHFSRLNIYEQTGDI